MMYYNEAGRLVIRVEVPQAFKRSSFISDVLLSGRHFVVDVENGNLLIEGKADKIELFFEYKDINNNIVQKKISKDFDVAEVQLKEWVDYSTGYFRIYNNNNVVFSQKLVDYVSRPMLRKAFQEYVHY